MRVLLDECLPRRLAQEIVGHDVATVADVGWSGALNGDLIRRASWLFDAFVTVEQGLAGQQHLVAEADSLAVFLLAAPTCRVDALRELVPNLQRALDAPRAGKVVSID